MRNSDLEGVVAATLTPVDEAFEVDVARLAQHIDHLLGRGCSFVSTFGTTGEGASLSTAQKATALDALVAEGIAAEKMISSVMAPSVEEAAGMVEASARLGCRSVLILPPFYYNDPSRQGIVDFIGDVLRRAGRPNIDILLYNIPQLTGVSYDAELVLMLQKAFGSAIAGIKDSTGDLANSIALAQQFPELSVFTGDDRVMPKLVATGGAGIIGGLPNLYSADLRRIWEKPEDESTSDLRTHAGRRIEALDSNGGLVALKALLASVRDDPEWTRAIPPLCALSADESGALLHTLSETGDVPEKVR